MPLQCPPTPHEAGQGLAGGSLPPRRWFRGAARLQPRWVGDPRPPHGGHVWDVWPEAAPRASLEHAGSARPPRPALAPQEQMSSSPERGAPAGACSLRLPARALPAGAASPTGAGAGASLPARARCEPSAPRRFRAGGFLHSPTPELEVVVATALAHSAPRHVWCFTVELRAARG